MILLNLSLVDRATPMTVGIKICYLKINQLPIIIGSGFFGYKILLDNNHDFFLGSDSYGGLATRNDIAVAKLDTKGALTISFNGSNLPSGVYYYKIKAGNFIQVKQMILIK